MYCYSKAPFGNQPHRSHVIEHSEKLLFANCFLFIQLFLNNLQSCSCFSSQRSGGVVVCRPEKGLNRTSTVLCDVDNPMKAFRKVRHAITPLDLSVLFWFQDFYPLKIHEGCEIFNLGFLAFFFLTQRHAIKPLDISVLFWFRDFVF